MASDMIDTHHDNDSRLYVIDDSCTNITEEDILNTTWTALTSNNNIPDCMGFLLF